MSRYLLQKSDKDPLWWALVDTVEQIVCQFKEGDFNGSQRVTTLNDDSDYDFAQLPATLCAMADWLRETHYEIMFSSPQLIAREARKDVGRQIKAAREAKGYTTRYLEKLTGVTHTHISRIEAGRYNVSVDILGRLCDALGVKIELK